MTYDVLASLQARIPAQLNQTWTQEPVILEDALGRFTPFHLEFIDSWEVSCVDLRYPSFQKLTSQAFDSALEIRFRHLPGHRKIKRKEYSLRSNSMNKEVDTSIAFNRCFLPGQRYDMSMLFNAAHVQNSCPGCHLDGEEASDARVQW